MIMIIHLTMASAVRPPVNSSGSADPGAKYLMVGYPWTPYSWPVLLCWVASRDPSSILPFSLVAASAQGWASVLQWPHLERWGSLGGFGRQDICLLVFTVACCYGSAFRETSLVLGLLKV